MPTERFRFQSNYFKNFEMSGSVGYSTSNNQIPNFLETVDGFTARTGERGSTTSGPANAKRVSVNANWSGVYSITDKLRILDEFRYDNWRIPGTWALDETNIFGTGFPGLAGLQQSEAVFNAANCPPPYSAPTCPQHAPTTPTSAGSAADVITGLASTFLGQNLKSNTLELQYDFNRRVSAHIGYLYTNRTIAQFGQGGPTDAELIYYPSLRSARKLRDRCAVDRRRLRAQSRRIGDLHRSCGGQSNSKSNNHQRECVVAGSGRAADGRPPHYHRSGVRLQRQFVFANRSAASAVLQDPCELQTAARGQCSMARSRFMKTATTYYGLDNLEHDRSYSFSALLMANQRLSVDFGYNYWSVFTQSEICFNYSTTYTFPNPTPPPATLTGIASSSPPGVATTACPIPNASVGAPPTASPPGTGLGALSTYSSTDHFAHAAVMWKPTKRVTAMVGYGGSFVRGNTIFLNPLTPSGTLDFNYQRPYASVAIDVYRNLSYKMAWNYYGFTQTGNTNPFGLASIQSANFNGSNATFSFRYAF